MSPDDPTRPSTDPASEPDDLTSEQEKGDEVRPLDPLDPDAEVEPDEGFLELDERNP